MKKWCNNCNKHVESWADNPSYSPSETHRRDERCWDCNKWTLINCHGCCDHGAYEALKRAENRNSSLYSDNARLQGELEGKNVKINEKDTQIATYKTELVTTRSELVEKKGELKANLQKLDTLTGLFNDLKIEGINKDKEIEGRGKDIENLEGALGKSQDENFNHKIKEQEKKLETFIQQLGINREKPHELRKVYQQLIRSRENYNQDNITRAEDEIEKIKNELLSSGWFNRGMSLENVQKLCNRCEKIANLKIEQGKIQEQQWKRQQQQYQAHQEQPTNNN